jgi:type IV secretory pathway VirB6-like protein
VDLINAERELTQRDADLAALKGQMQYLSQSAQLSSINVELRASVLNQPLVQQGWRPSEAVHQAFTTLINGLQGVGNFLILFAIAILPWLLVVGLVLYGIIRLIMWRIGVSKRRKADTV